MKLLKYILSLLVLSSTSCLRLDNNLFNNIKTDEYRLDATTAEQEISVDASYSIPDSLIHVLQLTSNDDGNTATIYAEYLGNTSRIATDTVIMYFHGNKGNMDYYWNRAKLLANVGGKNHFGIMTIDYRGYGKSEGTPTESGMYADAEAALKWLAENGLTGDRLIVYGFSLGTAAATYKTANPEVLIPSKLILEAPFAAASVMVQDATALALPPSYFTNLKVDNAVQIEKVKQPFMWLHGINDAFLSIKTHGEVVYSHYHGIYSEAHRIPGGTHTNVPQVWGLDNYKQAVLQFIRR
jgi:pimeloyl-ACP methyl ester carboxylesterase